MSFASLCILLNSFCWVYFRFEEFETWRTEFSRPYQRRTGGLWAKGRWEYEELDSDSPKEPEDPDLIMRKERKRRREEQGGENPVKVKEEDKEDNVPRATRSRAAKKGIPRTNQIKRENSTSSSITSLRSEGSKISKRTSFEVGHNRYKVSFFSETPGNLESKYNSRGMSSESSLTSLNTDGKNRAIQGSSDSSLSSLDTEIEVQKEKIRSRLASQAFPKKRTTFYSPRKPTFSSTILDLVTDIGSRVIKVLPRRTSDLSVSSSADEKGTSINSSLRTGSGDQMNASSEEDEPVSKARKVQHGETARDRTMSMASGLQTPARTYGKKSRLSEPVRTSFLHTSSHTDISSFSTFMRPEDSCIKDARDFTYMDGLKGKEKEYSIFDNRKKLKVRVACDTCR
jgi:hypothetical protein